MTQQDYKVADIELAEFGRKEIRLAESEMPALMALRRKYQPKQPLKGARIIGCIHMTVQTAVLIETLAALGAEVRWSSCNIFSTQDHAAAAMAAAGIPVFAWKGETEDEYWWCIEQTINKDGKPWDANLLLDDGGDLTQRIHETYPRMLDKVHGISEETTTGVHRLYDMLKAAALKVPVINVNDSVTKSKNDNKYGCRHSLNDAIKRGTDMLLAGRRALVIGYGDVGKGSAQSLRQEGMIVRVAEIDPICAMQACMDGYEVVSPYLDGLNTGPHRRHRQTPARQHRPGRHVHRQLERVRREHAARRSSAAPWSATSATSTTRSTPRTCARTGAGTRSKIRCTRSIAATNRADYLILLSEGRLVNLGNAMGHPSRVMDGSFANQVLAQMHLYEQRWADQPPNQRAPITIEVLPKKLDEEVAQLMVEGFGGVVTRLTGKQAKYIGVKPEGPFKPESYKY